LCNDKPDINGSDGGTWRRVRVVNFDSKFVKNPTQPHELPLDDELQKKFENWAPHFMALLLEYYRSYSVNRLVEPEDVTRCTDEYQRENDHYADFVDTCLERGEADDFLTIDDIFQEFRDWIRADNIPVSIPKKKIVRNYVDKNVGKVVGGNNPSSGIRGWRIRDRSAVRVDLEEDDNDDL